MYVYSFFLWPFIIFIFFHFTLFVFIVHSLIMTANLTVGVHNITYFAADPSGNRATCQFTVTVLAAAGAEASTSTANPATLAGAAGGVSVVNHRFVKRDCRFFLSRLTH